MREFKSPQSLRRGRNTPVYVWHCGVMLVSEVTYQIILWDILLPLAFHCGATVSRCAFAFFVLNVSSMASWKPFQAQIWSDGEGELEGAPKRCDERRSMVECVPARVFWMGAAAGSLTESWFGKVFNSPMGDERLFKMCSKTDQVTEDWLHFSV